MDFQIGALFVKVAAWGEDGKHMNIAIIAPIGGKTMIGIHVNLSNEQGTQPLTGAFRTYEKGDKREENWALNQ